MTNSQTLPIQELIETHADIAGVWSVLWRRLEFSGALPPDSTMDALTGDQAASLAAAIAQRGLPELSDAPGWGDLSALAKDPEAFARAIRRLSDQIEMSPQPSGEWTPVIDALGETLVADLLGVSPSSVRRYSAGSRVTPQIVAERLHFLAIVLADLAGSYNEYGMRRWFTRPRSALDGLRPGELLGAFDPDGPDAARVAGLAAALPGLGAV